MSRTLPSLLRLAAAAGTVAIGIQAVGVNLEIAAAQPTCLATESNTIPIVCSGGHPFDIPFWSAVALFGIGWLCLEVGRLMRHRADRRSASLV